MKRNKGFTIMELMVVISIIAILLAIMIPNFISYKKKAEARRKANPAVVMEQVVPKTEARNSNQLEKLE